MRPGTKPKPTVLKRMAGNPGKRPLNDHEPKMARGRWNAPSSLGDEGKRVWRVLMRVLAPAGVITEGDLVALQLFCEAFEDRQAARKAYLEKGMVGVGSTGNDVLSMYFKAAHMKGQEMRWFLAEFGLTPSSRSRIKVEQASEKSLAEMLFDAEVEK